MNSVRMALRPKRDETPSSGRDKQSRSRRMPASVTNAPHPPTTTLASGLLAAEGPVALADGSVLICELMSGALGRLAPDGSLTRIELDGGPNGAAIGPDGRCYVCNNGGLTRRDVEQLMQGRPAETPGPPRGSIQAVDLSTGAVERLYDACGGAALTAPNDLVFDADGGFYFTDHGNLLLPGPQPGAVYYARPDGADIRLAIPGMESPNGVGLSPDGRTLYVAETHAGRLWRAPISRPGVVGHGARAILFEDPDLHMDSMAVQANGAVCVAVPGRNLILRVSADGNTAERIPTPPGAPTNICFAGADRRTAYITSLMSGELWRADWDQPGLALRF
jgi:gluconolactonase